MRADEASQSEILEEDLPPLWRAIEKETSSMIDKNKALKESLEVPSLTK